MRLTVEHLNEASFDWLNWRNGSVLEIFDIRHRYEPIYRNRDLVRQYAVGYCKADNIPCRPKPGSMAVMFDTGRENWNPWWTHFTVREFTACFPEEEVW